jgi:hypothetical protein
MVSMAAKWAYCEEHGRSFDDPSVTLAAAIRATARLAGAGVSGRC